MTTRRNALSSSRNPNRRIYGRLAAAGRLLFLGLGSISPTLDRASRAAQGFGTSWDE
ncbi:MAG: hypothetical protein AB7T32_14965 [Dehalococcoidia bacterium]